MGFRVLHVAPYADAAWAYGGIPRVVGALGGGLVRRGHHVTFCTTDACDADTRLGGRAQTFAEWPPERLSNGVIRRVFPNISNRLAYRHQAFLPVGLWGFLREHAREFDIAHLHACRNVPGVFAWRCLRDAAVPYVLTPNGTAPAIERKQTMKRLFDAAVGRRLIADAAAILAVSVAERQQLIASGVPASVIREILNPIDLREFSELPPRGQWRERWKVGDAPLVLFLGRITPRKNVDVLIRAFASLGDRARLVIAGNAVADVRVMRALARDAGVSDRTIFTGLLTGTSRIEVLAEADVVVYPSQHEVFGLVPFEALLAGTPVIVADDSGCGDLVGATGGGLVVRVNDPEALARAIRTVLNDKENWRIRAERAAVGVRQQYGADVVCAALENVYADLVTKQQMRRSA